MTQKPATSRSSFLSFQPPAIGEEEVAAVSETLRSGWLTTGPRTAELERRFAEYAEVEHALAVTSGTAALHLLMLARGLGPGDEVITSPFTFVSSANAALFVGAKPVFVDIETETYCLDPSKVEASITPRTRVIMPVDLYGHPASINELRELADRRGVILIEDACQAHGAGIDGRKAGALGVDATFSFYPTKNITTGEGGMVTTDDDVVAEKVTMLRQHGATERYHHDILGYNFRMTEIAAAIGRAQLKKLDHWNEVRRRNASLLDEGLAGTPGVRTPRERPGRGHRG